MAAKKRRSFGRRRRGSVRAPRRKSMKSKIIKIITLGIAVGPEAVHAIGTYQGNGGGANGAKQAMVDVVSAYSGMNLNDGHFYANDLVRGYAPIVAAVLFRKAIAFVRI